MVRVGGKKKRNFVPGPSSPEGRLSFIHPIQKNQVYLGKKRATSSQDRVLRLGWVSFIPSKKIFKLEFFIHPSVWASSCPIPTHQMGWMMDGLTIDHRMISSSHSGKLNLFFFTGEICSKREIQKTKKRFWKFSIATSEAWGGGGQKK